MSRDGSGDALVNAGTSTIILDPSGSSNIAKFYGADNTYYNVDFVDCDGAIYFSNTFENLSIDPGMICGLRAVRRKR
jgi:hypothetical protein